MARTVMTIVHKFVLPSASAVRTVDLKFLVPFVLIGGVVRLLSRGRAGITDSVVCCDSAAKIPFRLTKSMKNELKY